MQVISLPPTPSPESCSISISSLFKIQQERETGPQLARANLGWPDLQLLKDKINIITIKDRMIQTEFREGKKITSVTKRVEN